MSLDTNNSIYNDLVKMEGQIWYTICMQIECRMRCRLHMRACALYCLHSFAAMNLVHEFYSIHKSILNFWHMYSTVHFFDILMLCCIWEEANNISQDFCKSFWVCNYLNKSPFPNGSFTRCQVRVAALLAVEELCGEERSRTRKARPENCWSQQSLIHHPRSPTIWNNRKW